MANCRHDGRRGLSSRPLLLSVRWRLTSSSSSWRSWSQLWIPLSRWMEAGGLLYQAPCRGLHGRIWGKNPIFAPNSPQIMGQTKMGGEWGMSSCHT